jgi:hypothetical protein
MTNRRRLLVTSNNQSKEESDFEAHYARYPWPLRDITVPHNHDVLFGRGGGTNNHPGNKRYRQLVEERKARYVRAARNEKPLIALEIVTWLREKQNPPGRFLQLNEKTKMWDDVGYKRAREKASQALREKTYATHAEGAVLQHDSKENSDHVDNFDANRDRPDPVVPTELDKTIPSNLGNSLSEDKLVLEKSSDNRDRIASVNSLQLDDVFSHPPFVGVYFENEENTSPQAPYHPGIKRSTSHNVEGMKEMKFPRNGKSIANGLERQHSLAAFFLPGAVLDSPASPFFDEKECGLSGQLSELSISFDMKQLSDLFYG